MIKETIKLFHTGDFHLDSPFSGFGLRESDGLKKEHRLCFSKALKKAKDEGCDAVIIAGDLFDGGFVTPSAVRECFDTIKEAGLPVIVAPGNHDPYVRGGIYDRGDKPENLYVFSEPRLSRLDLDEVGLSVHGYAFISDRLESSPINSERPILNENNFNILLAHGDLYSPISKYAPISPAALEASGLDYAALGHVHKADPPFRFGRTTAAYCGFPEGRGFDEQGFGGALIVTLYKDGRTPLTDRIVLSERQYLTEHLDVSGCDSRSAIASEITRHIEQKGYGTETRLHLILEGAVSPDCSAPAANSVESRLGLLRITDATSPVYDAELLENDLSLRGALYRRLLPALSSADEGERAVAAEALRLGLAALEGKPLPG